MCRKNSAGKMSTKAEQWWNNIKTTLLKVPCRLGAIAGSDMPSEGWPPPFGEDSLARLLLEVLDMECAECKVEDPDGWRDDQGSVWCTNCWKQYTVSWLDHMTNEPKVSA